MINRQTRKKQILLELLSGSVERYSNRETVLKAINQTKTAETLLIGLKTPIIILTGVKISLFEIDSL